jgi:hypothetical protein
MGITRTKREKARSVLMYKIVHNFVEIHAEHLLIPADSRTRGIVAKSVVFTVRNRVEHYLHLGLHGKGNIP